MMHQVPYANRSLPHHGGFDGEGKFEAMLPHLIGREGVLRVEIQGQIPKEFNIRVQAISKASSEAEFTLCVAPIGEQISNQTRVIRIAEQAAQVLRYDEADVIRAGSITMVFPRISSGRRSA